MATAAAAFFMGGVDISPVSQPFRDGGLGLGLSSLPLISSWGLFLQADPVSTIHVLFSISSAIMEICTCTITMVHGNLVPAVSNLSCLLRRLTLFSMIIQKKRRSTLCYSTSNPSAVIFIVSIYLVGQNHLLNSK
jgi:hypothetical protein